MAVSMTSETGIKHPTIFISYSWTSPIHEQWVLDLSNRLMGNEGISVILDKWHLKPGQDKYAFMEQSVKSDKTDKVLLICDLAYASKANERTGGVGTETQIITKDIYDDISQQKFIPIVAERDADGKEKLPHYLQSRMYIDLSDESEFEENFRKLVRTIWSSPEISPPKLSSPPSWLFESQQRYFKTHGVLKQLENAIQQRPNLIKAYSQNFINSLLQELDTFRLSRHGEQRNQQIPFDEEVFNSIHEATVLRDDFIKFIELSCLSDVGLSYLLDNLVRFFEAFEDYTKSSSERGTVNSWEGDFDNYRFLIWEFFLYCVCVLLKKEQFEFVNEFLLTQFFFNEKYNGNKRNLNFTQFSRQSMQTFSERKERLRLNRRSLAADLIVDRTTSEYSKLAITSTDMVLFYLSHMNFSSHWVPKTFFYQEHKRIEMLERLKSRRHFEKVKSLFQVNEPSELGEKIKKIRYESLGGILDIFDNVLTFENNIDPQDIATIT